MTLNLGWTSAAGHSPNSWILEVSVELDDAIMVIVRITTTYVLKQV
jgi:hypothetical protein